MAAPKGNKYWQLRKNFRGKQPKYTPKKLWDKFAEYCEWVDANPFQEAVLVQKGIKVETEDGDTKTKYSTELPKMRPYTLSGFYVFADMDRTTFYDYEQKEEYATITTRIRNVIYTQKFEGAASGFFNANIIARDLGLADKQEHGVKVEQPLFGESEEE